MSASALTWALAWVLGPPPGAGAAAPSDGSDGSDLALEACLDAVPPTKAREKKGTTRPSLEIRVDPDETPSYVVVDQIRQRGSYVVIETRDGQRRKIDASRVVGAPNLGISGPNAATSGPRGPVPTDMVSVIPRRRGGWRTVGVPYMATFAGVNRHDEQFVCVRPVNAEKPVSLHKKDDVSEWVFSDSAPTGPCIDSPKDDEKDDEKAKKTKKQRADQVCEYKLAPGGYVLVERVNLRLEQRGGRSSELLLPRNGDLVEVPRGQRLELEPVRSDGAIDFEPTWRCLGRLKGCRPIAKKELTLVEADGSSSTLVSPLCRRPPRPVAPHRELPFTGARAWVDQDRFHLRRTDENYTMGAAIELSGAWVELARLDRPLRVFDFLTGIKVLRRRHDRHAHSFAFGVTAFTPRRLDLTTVVEDDRPFGSLLFLSTKHQSVDPRRRLTLTTELTLGIFGLPKLTEPIQIALHVGLRGGCGTCWPVDTKGWRHQISAGGEPSLMYRVALDKLISDSRWHQLRGTAQVEVGYHTAGSGGLRLRLGRLSRPFWNDPTVSPVSVQNELVASSPQTTGAGKKVRWELYLFGGLRGRFVVYNAMLQGLFRESAHRFSGSEIQRWLAEWDYGAGLEIAGVYVTYTIESARTEEFIGAGRVHRWGSIQGGYSRRF